MHIKKDDQIIVLTGKDKGKKGKVLHVFHEQGKVIVDGVAIKKKHQKATKRGGKGAIIEKATPIHASNVALMDPKSGRATRIGIKMIGDKKVRISKKSGVEI
ncbi:MAG: 50S ribosomal protein L24 [Parcubacteria group bacterium]|nr:50S ribosomal protein L24 [Parcubacteria group bacterium]